MKDKCGDLGAVLKSSGPDYADRRRGRKSLKGGPLLRGPVFPCSSESESTNPYNNGKSHNVRPLKLKLLGVLHEEHGI